MREHLLKLGTGLRAFSALAVAVVACTSVTYSQDTWTSLAPVSCPSPMPCPTEGMTVGGVGHVIIAAYGFDGNTASSTNLTRLYNISTNSWTLGPPAPFPPRSEAAYGKTTHGRFLYVAGGVMNEAFAGGSGMVINNLERYDSVNKTWTTLAPMPTARAGAAAAVIKDAIYVIGGRTNGSFPCSLDWAGTAVLERYDIDNGTWSTKMSLPSPRSDMAAVAHEGKIYVFGGCSGFGTATNEVDVYNPGTDTWSTGLTPMPTARAGLVAGHVGDNVYAISGCPGCVIAPPVNVNEVYDIDSNSWSTALPIPTARAEAGVHSRGDRIYVLGGFDASENPTAANEVFRHKEKDEDEGEGGDKNNDDMNFNDSPSKPDTSSLEYNDPSKDIYLQSVNAARSITYNGPCVSFVGDALLSDNPGYVFAFAACDLSALGTGIGNFSIAITGPSGFLYQKNAVLTSGSMHIHPQ
jgi:hypothetical protein